VAKQSTASCVLGVLIPTLLSGRLRIWAHTQWYGTMHLSDFFVYW